MDRRRLQGSRSMGTSRARCWGVGQVIPEAAVEAEVRADIARIIREEANEYDGRIVVSPDEAALDLYLAGYRKVIQ